MGEMAVHKIKRGKRDGGGGGFACVRLLLQPSSGKRDEQPEPLKRGSQTHARCASKPHSWRQGSQRGGWVAQRNLWVADK